MIKNIICKSRDQLITERDSGSLVDSLKSATRILVGSALAPAPVADRTFNPLRTHAARRATYKTWRPTKFRRFRLMVYDKSFIQITGLWISETECLCCFGGTTNTSEKENVIKEQRPQLEYKIFHNLCISLQQCLCDPIIV